MAELAVGDAAPDLILLDPDEKPLALSSLWNRGPLALIVLRHFGCPMCHQHLAAVQKRLGEFERRGAQVIAVGQGTGAEAAAAARRHRITYPVLGDPGHQTYRTLGLARTGWWGLTLAPFFRDFRTSWANLKQADLGAAQSPRSDVMRLGGALVVGPDGRIRFLHRSQSTTDVPSTDALLAALDR